MADLQLLDCFQPELVRLERVRFFPRQLLSAEDLITEQDYFRQKLRRHNRFLHGWGVVCGLEVVPAPTDDAPWLVEITAGYALGPYGDELYLGKSFTLDLAKCGQDATTNPCEPNMLDGASDVTGGTLYVAIKYAECTSKPVRVMPAGCACEDVACEYARIRDSFELGCLTELPPSPETPLLCDLINDGTIPPCPPCPEDPWVVLAAVQLPAPGVELSNDAIDNLGVRRQLASTAVLQQQLIACCCEEQPQVTADLEVRKVLETNEPADPTGTAIRLLTFRIDVRNNGPSAAHNVVITDTLNITTGAPSHVEFVPLQAPAHWLQDSQGLDPQQTQHVFVAALGTLQPSPTVVALRFKLTVRMDSGNFVLTNAATATSDTTDPVSANNTMTIISANQPPE
jgi:hypothetical protein